MRRRQMDTMIIDCLKKNGQKILVKKNEGILMSGQEEKGEYAYYLESGIVALGTITSDGEERVYLYFRGKRLVAFLQLLGSQFESSASGFDRKRRIGQTDIVLTAKTDCVIYRISRKKFQELIDMDIKFNRFIIQTVSENYMELLNHFQQVIEESASIRLCRLLLESYVEVEGKKILPKTLSFSEMSKYLGTHPVTVSRIIAALRKEGCVTKEKAVLIITNEERLREIVKTKEEIK